MRLRYRAAMEQLLWPLAPEPRAEAA
jgi:hypothetical protein